MHPRNIILAEDDLDDIIIFKDALSQTCSNYNLQTVEDGEHLIKMLQNMEPPDLVIIDLNMPKISGLECLKWIRENKKLSSLPVLILSTSSSPADKFNCIKSGADRYIVKPNSFDTMKGITAKICNGSWLFN